MKFPNDQLKNKIFIVNFKYAIDNISYQTLIGIVDRMYGLWIYS
jgi:hypothetical protein